MYSIKEISSQEIKRQQALRLKAKRLRKQATFTERLLWEQLRSRRLIYKFRRQHPYLGFILDFYSHEAQIVIEIDGASHDNIKLKDEARDKFLAKHGLIVLRFTNEEITNNMQEVIKKIKYSLPGGRDKGRGKITK